MRKRITDDQSLVKKPNDRPIDDETAPKPDEEQTESNPPWTTTGKITSPKFGAAGSGGGEYEPGPKKN